MLQPFVNVVDLGGFFCQPVVKTLEAQESLDLGEQFVGGERPGQTGVGATVETVQARLGAAVACDKYDRHKGIGKAGPETPAKLEGKRIVLAAVEHDQAQAGSRVAGFECLCSDFV